MIRTYFQMLLEEEMPGAEGKMKQFASWFTHGVPGGAALRKAIYEAKSAAEILGRVEEFFEARLHVRQPRLSRRNLTDVKRRHHFARSNHTPFANIFPVSSFST